MTVRLSDIIDVEVFQDISAENLPELTSFAGSGIITQNDVLNRIVNESGDTAQMPYWLDIDAATGSNTGGDPNTWSDDPAQKATPNRVIQEKQATRKAFLHNSWSASALVNQLSSGPNALDRVVQRIDSYWARVFQRRLVAASLGVYLANVANNSGDMVHDISIEDGDNAVAANLFSRSAFTNAAFTLGDAWQSTSGIGVHSITMQRMVDNDDIEYMADSAGNLTIPTYMGRRVIVDDGCPVIAGGTSGQKYVSVLFGEGAFGYADGDADVPVELEREASAGNGGGVDIIHSRKKWMLHPAGHNFTDDTVSGENNVSPTAADLALAANWTRKYNRKNVPLSFLITNG